jgi:carbamoyltransferase
MRILGINSVYHELAAALVVDGEVVAAAEEERFNRRKHGTEARVDNPDELPVEAIRYCLREAGTNGCELDAVCYSFDPALRREHTPDPYAVPGDWGHPEGEAVFLQGLQRVPGAVSNVVDADISGRFHWVSHHLAHAASAYYPSGFDRAAILVIDGIGENATVTLSGGDGPAIRTFWRIWYPNSLGFLWEKMSRFLGFGEYDACKVMGLAAYGDAAECRHALGSFVSVDGNGTFEIRPDVLQFRRSDFDGLEAALGPVGTNGRREDIAAALQSTTDEVVMTLVRTLHRRFRADSLCIAGGVGLNCHTNWLVKEQGPFERMYVPSAPHDAGTAVGAALHHYHGTGGATDNPPPVPTMPTPYVGPEFGEREIENALAARGLPATRPRDLGRTVAELLAGGKVVGWFQGRMEFGPRALGNRSLLADPRDPEIREVLNRKVKHREPFRPFAPSVLDEQAGDWLELGRPSASYAFMSFACKVRDAQLEAIPAVVHVDGTSRAQIVERTTNPEFHGLISEFERLTEVPLLLNTSFNDSEPIVCTPDDALNTFTSTLIDAVAIGPYLVERAAS